jgi:hypothetical protein
MATAQEPIIQGPEERNSKRAVADEENIHISALAIVDGVEISGSIHRQL